MDAARSAACLAQTASCKRTGKSGSASSANDRNHREERSATQWAGRGQAVDNPGMIPGPESCPQAVPERASSYQRDVNAIKFNKFNKLIVLQPAFHNTIDRKSVVSGKRVSVRVDLGGQRSH